MKNLLLLLAHLLSTVVRYLGPGGANAMIAENLLLKQQLLVISRARRPTPNLIALDWFLLGLWSLFIRPSRLFKVAVVIRPSTLLKFPKALKKRKYKLLFSPRRNGKPGPKGPSLELVQLIVEMKRRNPRFGCPRIAQQISRAFGIYIDKDVVMRVLAKHYRPGSDEGGLPG